MCECDYKPDKPRRESSEEFARRYPHHHLNFFRRPDISRRMFFKVAGAGLAGSYLAGTARAAALVQNSGMVTRNSAKNCIFVLLSGAISHVDSFDFKYTPGQTPESFNPGTVNGISWPAGLLPRLGERLSDIAIVRSMSSWALVHSLAQTWAQIGRNPVAALGDIAPNIGSIVALEKEKERRPGQIFPTFIALNAGGAAGQGYLSAAYAPFHIANPRAGVTTIPNTTNSFGESRFTTMFGRLAQYDGALRKNSPYGDALEDYDKLYEQARGLMYNPVVNQAFNVAAADDQRYGSSAFGRACLVAKQVLAADQGTRFIQINFGGWDHHANIYVPQGSSMVTMGPQLDNALAALIDDLKGAGLFNNTLIVVLGEFGRTPRMSAQNGRDHYLIQSALFAGGGVRGGTVIGATNDVEQGRGLGATVTEFGWAGSGNTGPRYVRPEDVESTILTAMGIDWTTIRYDDPFGRGYEYVPFAKEGQYGPVQELFA
jgi:hypothetical protein